MATLRETQGLVKQSWLAHMLIHQKDKLALKTNNFAVVCLCLLVTYHHII